MQSHSGGCLCGAVRYEAKGPLREVIFCHCGQCRKQTGLYFAATAVAQTAFTLHDSGALRWYAASEFAKRGFCGTCGSVLFWKPNEAGHISILAGSLDQPDVLTPGYHICTEGRPSYYAINDGLAQYAASSPGLPIADS